MNSQINLPAIYIANLMGLIVIIVVMMVNSWRLTSKTKDNHYLRIMVITAIAASVADPMAYTLDGLQGMGIHVLVYVSNLMLYLANMVLGVAWIYFVSSYINVKLSNWHKCLLIVLNAIGAVVLAVNMFYPLAFVVNADNVYSRCAFYMYFMIMEAFTMLDGVVIYFYARHRSGRMKFFPVWACVIPVAIGLLIQYFFYGLSTTWPFICVGVGGVVFSLQNDQMFKDKLTGLYNRSYLDVVKTRSTPRIGRRALTAMMLDLNDFKSINDTYGHAVGDDALIQTAKVLAAAVGSRGEVIRYAGDEFIILLNSQDDLLIQKVINDISAGFETLKNSGKKKYTLSISVGYSKLGLDECTMDELIDITDKKMYDNKNKYYSQAGHNRRRG